MDGRKARDLAGSAGLPTVPRIPERERTLPVADAVGSLPRGWVYFAALIGPIVAAFCMAIEPPPADPEAATPLLAVVLFVGLLASWAGAAQAAWRRRPQALAWATIVGALSVAITVGCPASGHHAIGAWWFAQLAVSGGATAVAVRASLRYGAYAHR